MKVLLVRGPRYYWPFINEYDNFLLPQSLPCLAAVLRKNGIDVKPIDCAPLKIGWRSLAKLLREEKPDVVGVGDSESIYAQEAVKVLKLAKEINPETTTIAGGAHFGNLIEESLSGGNLGASPSPFPLPSGERIKVRGNNLIDFIVKGEGEYTLLELVKELEISNPNFRKIRGIAFRESGKIVETPPRPLIENLDELPLPAYDLIPMDAYGKSKYLFSPGGITIHHSRGCNKNCDFCVWWVQMAQRKIENGEEVLYPKWRTKSVERTIEEIKLLYHKYRKHYLVFVDDSWNTNQSWNEEFAEKLLEEGFDLHWFAFMRADLLLRDEKAGILRKLVDAGLSHISIGVERARDSDLKSLGKPFYSPEITKECLAIFKNKYPQVFRQVTFILGTREETKESVLEQVSFAREIAADYPAFHSLTPFPGTKTYKEAKENRWLEIEDFDYYDMVTPLISSKYLSRKELEYLIYLANRKFVSFPWIVKGLFSPYKIKRNMYIWWLLVLLKVFGDSVKRFINPFKVKEYTRLMRPKWYDS